MKLVIWSLSRTDSAFDITRTMLVLPTTKGAKMGMDVIGSNATSERGSYFRNNVWWWRPLAEFVCETYPEIARKCELWGSNDGDGLDETDSAILGQMILNDIADGTVEQYARQRLMQLSELPRETCQWCRGTGIRTDEIGTERGMDNELLPVETQMLVGRTNGTCNACSGIGTKENWAINYGFSVDNVKDFAEFLKDCGGFQIC